MLQIPSAPDNFWLTCQWVVESLWLSPKLVSLDSTEHERSGTAVDLEVVWLSDCSNQLGSASVLSALLCCSPN